MKKNLKWISLLLLLTGGVFLTNCQDDYEDTGNLKGKSGNTSRLLTGDDARRMTKELTGFLKKKTMQKASGHWNALWPTPKAAFQD